MSVYDEERKKLGLKALGTSTSSKKTPSIYDREREELGLKNVDQITKQKPKENKQLKDNWEYIPKTAKITDNDLQPEEESAFKNGLKKFNSYSDAVLDPFFDMGVGLTKPVEKLGGKLADLTANLFLDETLEEREARHKKIALREKENQDIINPTAKTVLNTTGEVLGSIAGLGKASAIGKATIGKKLAEKGIKGTTKRVLDDAITGGIYEGVNALTSDKSPLEIAEEVGKGALLFGVAGGLGEAAGKGFKKLISGKTGKYFVGSPINGETVRRLTQEEKLGINPRKIILEDSPKLTKNSFRNLARHYGSNVAKGVVAGPTFSYGENLLEGEELDNKSAAQQAAIFAGLNLLTGGKYRKLNNNARTKAVKDHFDKKQANMEKETLGEMNDKLKKIDKGIPLKNETWINKDFIEDKMVKDAWKEEGKLLAPKSELPIETGNQYANKPIDSITFEPTDVKTAKSQQTKSVLDQNQIETPIVEIPSGQVPTNIPKTEASKKPLKFIKNSVLGSKVAPEGMKQQFKENMPTYEPITNKETWDKNASYFESNPEQIKSEWKNKTVADSADDTALGQIMIVDAIKKGNMEEATKISEQLAQKLRQAGQTVQAASIFKRLSAEGMLMDAQRTILKVRTEVEKTNPKAIQEVEKNTKEVTDLFNEVNKDVIDNVVKDVEQNVNKIVKKESKKLLPEELLVKKVSSTLKQPKEKEVDLEKEMVNTLFNIAKKVLPEKPKTKKNPLEPVILSLKNKQQYQEVWQKAKTLLKEKYSNDPEKLAILDNYLEKKLRPVFEQGKLNQAINQSLKEMGIDLGKIVREHYTVGSQVRDNLVKKLVKEAGLTGEEAITLEKYIRNRMKELTKTKKETILKQMFKKRNIPPHKTLMDKIIESSNLGAFENSEYKNIIGEKLGIPYLSDSEAKFIVEEMNKLSEIPKGPRTDYLRKAALSKIQTLIANKIPVTMADKLKGIVRISMLPNPKTLLTRNPAGNTLLAIAENVKDIPSALTDIAVSKFTGERKTLLNPLQKLGKQFEGAGQGLKEWGKDIKYGVDTNPTPGQAEIIKKRIFADPKLETRTWKRQIDKGLNFLDTVTKRGLYLGDRPFYQAAYNSRLNELMEIKKAKEIKERGSYDSTPTPEMIEEAEKYALDRTFQGDTEIAKGASKLRDSFNQIFSQIGLGNKDFGVGNIVMPFTQTPANIFAKALDYSPLGMVKIVKQLKNIKTGTFDQKSFTDAVGRTATGALLFLIGWKLKKEGLITSNIDKDKDVNAFNKMIGKGNYAYVKGDTYVTFDWAQPISMPLAVGADMYESYKNEDDVVKAIISSLETGGNTFFNMSFMKNLNNLLNSYSPAAGIAETLIESPTQLSPTLGNQIARLVDPYTRETYDPNPVKTIANRLISRTPYLSKTLPPKIDTFGNEVEAYPSENFASRLGKIMLYPGNVTNYNPDHVSEMILDTYKQTGDKTIFPRVAPRYITVKGEKIILTPEEISNLQKYIGSETQKMYSQISPDLSPEQRVKIMKKILDEVSKRGRNKIRQEKGLPLEK